MSFIHPRGRKTEGGGGEEGGRKKYMYQHDVYQYPFHAEYDGALVERRQNSLLVDFNTRSYNTVLPMNEKKSELIWSA